MNKSIDVLPKNTLWSAITGTAIVGTPASVVTTLAGVWVPVVGDRLIITGLIGLFVSLASGIVSACWIVDDDELNTYRRLGPEGRAEVRKEVLAREIQIRNAITERQLGYSDVDGRFDEKRALHSRGAGRNDDDYWGHR